MLVPESMESRNRGWGCYVETDSCKFHGNETMLNFKKKSPSVLFSIWCHYGDRVCAYFLDYWPVPSASSLWENACLPNVFWLTPHYSDSLVRLSTPRLLLKNAFGSTESYRNSQQTQWKWSLLQKV